MILSAALAYAKTLNWSVIPLEPNGKKPLTANGYQDGSTNEHIIRAWWTRWPGANVGLVTGTSMSAYVVDVDTRNDGPSQLAQLERIYTELPTTVRAITASSGWHSLFKLPAGRLKSKLSTGIDIKRDGGYIVAPPSTIDGVPYMWQNAPWEVEIAIAPQWLSDMLRVEENVVSQLRYDGSDRLYDRARKYVANTPPAVSGQGGSTTTYKLAAKLVHYFKLDDFSALDCLQEYNKTCQPNWTTPELIRKIQQARRTFRAR